MTGQPLEGREPYSRNPLPPIGTVATARVQTDAALAGEPLPPYRPGLYSGRLVEEPAARAATWGAAPEPRDAAAAALGASSWDETAEEAQAVETWDARRAAWDAALLTHPDPPAGPPAIESETAEPAGGEPEPAAEASLDDADDAAGSVEAASAVDLWEHTPGWSEAELEAAALPEAGETGERADRSEDTPDGSGPEVEAAALPEAREPGERADLWEDAPDEAGAELASAELPEIELETAELSGAGDPIDAADLWEHAPGWADAELRTAGLPEADETSEPAGREPAPTGWDESWSGATSAALELPEVAEEEPAAHRETAVSDEWLLEDVTGGLPWDVAARSAGPNTDEIREAPAVAAGVGSPAPTSAPSAEPGAAWETWEPEDEHAAPPVDEEPLAWATDTAAPTDTASDGETGEHLPSTSDVPDDERVARVPATPLDSWYHVEPAAEAGATWEAFGRALEEAASWGDLGTTIATGLPPAERHDDPAAEPLPEQERAAQAEPVAAVAPETTPAAAASPPADALPPEAALADMAEHLEALARRLRREGEKGMEHALSEGDRLEASLAGFIAGYVAARRS
jgi:hypothetical protein